MGRRRASVYYILAAWDPEGLGLVRQSITVGQARAAGAASVVSDTQQYKTQHVAWTPGLACRRATRVALHPEGGGAATNTTSQHPHDTYMGAYHALAAINYTLQGTELQLFPVASAQPAAASSAAGIIIYCYICPAKKPV